MGTNSCSVSSPVGTEMLCSDWEALPICSGSIWEILSRCDHLQGFPGGLMVKSLPAMQEVHKRHRFDPWVGKIPWSRKWQPAPVFLPGKSHGQRSLVGYSPWGCQESDMTKHDRLQRERSPYVCTGPCVHEAVTDF